MPKRAKRESPLNYPSEEEFKALLAQKRIRPASFEDMMGMDQLYIHPRTFVYWVQVKANAKIGGSHD